jgi:MFS transporter, ACS family, hexuronate transporter
MTQSEGESATMPPPNSIREGGVLSPSIAGYAADRGGLGAPLWMMLGLTALAGLLAMGLRETAPRVLARRRGAAQPAV